MIQANELRVGNIVSDFGGREARISAITERGTIKLSSEHYTDESFNLNERVINSIPLTEEWLLKFGFEKREASTCVEWYIGINKITHDWLFSITWLTNPELIKAPDAPFYRNGGHTIYYVHQLQNLYFALTGQELTIIK